MKKRTFLLTVLLTVSLGLLTVGCNEAPKGFCECLEASKALNEKSMKVLQGNTDEKSKQALVQARSVQKEKCKSFENASGDNMRQWKEDCKN